MTYVMNNLTCVNQSLITSVMALSIYHIDSELFRGERVETFTYFKGITMCMTTLPKYYLRISYT